jgi:hypothetical protein
LILIIAFSALKNSQSRLRERKTERDQPGKKNPPAEFGCRRDAVFAGGRIGTCG